MSGEESSPRTAVGDLCASGKSPGRRASSRSSRAGELYRRRGMSPQKGRRMKKKLKKLPVRRETLADLDVRAALGGTDIVPDREVATICECPDLKAERVQES